jgi:dihydrodiol dehydrogenase / D-xylose 1-dehydrogenase (NADP)
MKKSSYGWGFIASGLMAKMMADDLQLTEGSRIMGVTARTEASAKNFANTYGVPNVYPSVEELVNDPEVDIVYISTPHNLHYENALTSLKAGKPVLLEKPFTVNAAQASSLVEMAREKKLFLMEAMWIRYLPIIHQLRSILDDGVVGQVRLFKAAFHQLLDFGPEHRLYNPALAGGSLLDLGIYPISLASFVFGGPPTQVSRLPYLGKTGVDVRFGAVFQYEDRSMALLSAGADGLHPQDVNIYGTKGEIRLHGHQTWKYDRMTVNVYGEKEETFHAPFEGGGYSFQAEEVLHCLETGKLESEAISLQETVAIVETLDRIRAQWGLRYPDES